MAGSIKGIIVEIGGDTSGLQKALSKVNSATSSLSRELRGINSLLKLDPKNTELLAQKQQVLNENIGQTEEKLKRLHSAYQRAVEEEVNGKKISEENWRAIQRDIINTENKLKQLKLEASNWTQAGRKIEEIGTKIETIGNKVDNLGNKLTTRVTVPLIALGTVGVKSAAEQEAAMQQVENIYGEASGTIKDFAENTAISYNMSTKEAYKYSQVFGNLIQSITDDQKENAQYTQELLKASSVIASSTGRTMEDVMDRIRSGLLGNTEAIEDLGVNVNVALLESTDAFKKFAGDKSWNQLDFQTQQQIRLFGILEQTTKRYGDEVNENTSSNIQKLTARFNNMSSKLNKNLLPVANKLIDKADKFIDKLDDLNDEEAENIVKIGMMVAAAGPLVKILGTTTKTIGSGVKAVGTFSQAIGVMKTGMDSSNLSANKLAKGLSALTSPAGLAALGITAAVTAITIAMKNAEKETKEAFSNMGDGASDFITGIDSATSHLDSFNSTLFASSEEQQKLQEDMDNVQKGITDICKRASDERRGYTQEEITQLDEYFNKLRELKNRELEIQKSISGAITQQAQQDAKTFQGTLNEYKVNSQDWIKTAQEQADKQLAIINERATQEIALLQQKYGEKATLENEEYAREYNNIIANKNIAIQEANDEVAQVNLAYANGFLERAQQNDGFYNTLKEYNSKIEEETTRHNGTIDSIDNNALLTQYNKNSSKEQENYRHKEEMKDIWNDMYKNMSDEQEKELGTWLAMVSQTEMYGGEIDEETRKIVDSIIQSYDSMPKETQEAMKNAMEPMLTEMENKEPSLFAKATGIADGILSRLKKSFDIHSPSRETRGIFQNVMKGAELGLEDEEKNLNKQIENISNKMKSDFQSLIPNMGAIKQSIIDQTKTIFTTPQIVFNVQELDEAKLNQCFNYINKKFGSAY